MRIQVKNSSNRKNCWKNVSEFVSDRMEDVWWSDVLLFYYVCQLVLSAYLKFEIRNVKFVES